MKIRFCFLLLFVFYFQFGNAQQLTKKHQIKKGETVYQISRIYNVTPQDIIKLNPNSESIIYAGDELIIPSNNNQGMIKVENHVNRQPNKTTHLVLKGETKYGLSKKYNISIAELEAQNPQIKNGLQTGHNLKITSLNNRLTTPKINQNNTYRSHLVLKGETLYGLSKQYEISISEIKSANPQLGILKYGNVISIPSKENIVESHIETKTKEIEENLEEEASQIEIEKATTEVSVIEDIRYKDYTIQPKETLYSLSKKANMSMSEFVLLNPQLEKSVLAGVVIKMPISTANDSIKQTNLVASSSNEYKDLSKSIDIVASKKIILIMPFTVDEFKQHEENSSSFENVTDSNLKQNFEFYKGAKLAIDSIRSIGINLKIDIIKINTSTSISKSDVNSKLDPIESYDAVIAPSYGNNIDWILTLANEKNIPIISAFNSSKNSKLTNIVEAFPSVDYQKLKVLEYLKNNNGNIIVVSDYNREGSRNFIEANTPKSNILVTKRNGAYSNKELIEFLDKSKTNYVIIDSDRNGVFLNTTNVLLRELTNYNIQLVVLESSLIPNEENISAKRFRILKMIYPEIAYTAISLEDKQFLINNNISLELQSSKNILTGFDITFDTLLRLCQLNGFDSDLRNNKTSQLCLKFDYSLNESGRYINNLVIVKEFESEKPTNETN